MDWYKISCLNAVFSSKILKRQKNDVLRKWPVVALKVANDHF